VFFDTLVDENAASHIALGQGYESGVGEPGDLARMNQSQIHVDFMIGGDDVAVTGVLADGEQVALLRGGAWQI
jgi:aminopeptidase